MYPHRTHTPLPRLLLSLFAAGLGLASFGSPLSAAAPSCPSSTPAGTPPAVLTSQYDNARDGYNPNESVLTSTALSGGAVSLCQPAWSPLAVESGPAGVSNEILAQPLYVPGISVVSPASAAQCNNGGNGISFPGCACLLRSRRLWFLPGHRPIRFLGCFLLIVTSVPPLMGHFPRHRNQLRSICPSLSGRNVIGKKKWSNYYAVAVQRVRSKTRSQPTRNHQTRPASF